MSRRRHRLGKLQRGFELSDASGGHHGTQKALHGGKLGWPLRQPPAAPNSAGQQRTGQINATPPSATVKPKSARDGVLQTLPSRQKYLD